MTNLFGEKIINNEFITFIYKGKKFSDHEINLKDFINELQGIDLLINETIKEYVRLGKISKEESVFEISVRIEDGSVKEIIKFIRKNKKAVWSVTTMVIIPFLNTGLQYYLNKDSNNNDFQNDEIVQVIKNNKNLRKGIEKTLSPIKGEDNILIINTGDGDVELNINQEQKDKIIEGIKEDNAEQDDKEEIVEENLHGIVSVSKVYDITPFNFRIQGTEDDTPMQFNDLEIDLGKRQDFLGKEMIIKGKVTYKNGKRILIEVIEHDFIENLFN